MVAIVACQKEPATTPNAVIEVETTELTFNDRGETKSLSYTIKNSLNGESLTASTEAEWVTIAVEADKLNITASGNYDDAERTAEVTLAYKGAENVTLRFHRDASQPRSPLR